MDNNIPFYLQVENYLKQKILMQELTPGDLIPSERELTEKFKLSRSTIRKAIHELVYQGYLVKVQGKGTYVAKHNLEKDLYKITNINCKKENQEEQIEFEVISESLLNQNDENMVIKLKPNSTEKIYYLKRTILIKERCVGLQKIWSYPEYINDINSSSFENIVHLGYDFSEEITITYPKKEEAKILSINKKLPLLRTKQTIYRDKPIIYMVSLFNSQEIKLTKKQHLSKGVIHRRRVSSK